MDFLSPGTREGRTIDSRAVFSRTKEIARDHEPRVVMSSLQRRTRYPFRDSDSLVKKEKRSSPDMLRDTGREED